MSSELVFVSADSLGQPRSTDRKLIRSRCMRGINRREGSRRDIRQARKRAKASNGAVTTDPQLSLNVKVDQMELKLTRRPNIYPCEIIAAGSSFDAAGQIDYAIESCVDFSMFRCGYFAWVFYDPAFVQSILFLSSGYHDLRLQVQPTRETQRHLQQTLSNLNQQLSQKDAYMAESVLYIVVVLAQMAVMFNDSAAAKSHVTGLNQMLQLRGGHEYLISNSKLQFKVDRLGLSWFLMTGHRADFVAIPDSWDSIFSMSRPFPKSATKPLSIRGLVHPWLVTIYEDLQNLIGLINENSDQEYRLSGSQFQDSISSIVSRLVHFKHGSDITSECIRLGMLAFLSTLYRISGLNAEYPYLAERIRHFYPQFEASTPRLRDIGIWMLIMGTSSTLSTDETWLRAKWAAIAGSRLRWKDARKKLARVMWIHSIHGEAEHQEFPQLMNQTLSESQEVQHAPP